MAKRTCDPTVGSIGRQTYLLGRYGQVVRTRVVPSNPNTAPQSRARAHFTQASVGWDALTQDQQLAWISAAKSKMSKSRLGMSGPLTGNQLYVKANANLLQIGSSVVSVPPTQPAWGTIDADSFDIEVNTGVAAMIVACIGSAALPTTTRLLAAAPVKNGVHRSPQLVDLGTSPAKTNSTIDISTIYKARFGEPPLDSKVFIAFAQTASGYDGPAVALNAVAHAP